MTLAIDINDGHCLVMNCVVNSYQRRAKKSALTIHLQLTIVLNYYVTRRSTSSLKVGVPSNNKAFKRRLAHCVTIIFRLKAILYVLHFKVLLLKHWMFKRKNVNVCVHM